jgi:hypothetical protein
MNSLDEESLADLLSKVLLIDNDNGGDEEDEIDGLEDLIPYISGLISTQLQEVSALEEDGASGVEEILDESLVPFLESVGLPEDRIEKAKAAVLVAATATTTTIGQSSTSTSSTTKLTQDRIVNMSSALHDDYTVQEEENESMWAASTQVKANANTEMDAFDFNTSAKDRRKAKQDIIRIRREYEIANEIATNDATQNATTTKSGVGCMILPTEKGNDMDVNLQNISVNLDNGTCLMEKGDLKFTYQRRYAVVGENGVGTYTVLVHLYFVVMIWGRSPYTTTPGYLHSR